MKPLEAQPDPEVAVVEAIAGGDRYALSEFMQRQGRWVRGVIFGACGRFADAEDVAQRVWLTVWREACRLEDPSRWRSWLYRIARNAATDAIRRHRRRRKLFTDLVDHQRSSPSLGKPSEAPLLANERQQAVYEAIAALPAIYREPFVLKHLEGWSYAQIGETLGLPTDTVETRLVRARRRLRELLQGKV